MFAMFITVRWVIGYIGLILIWATLLIWDSFSGDYDSFLNNLHISFNQIGALIIILFWFYGFYRIYKTPKNTEII